jgi:type I restriction enzyme S subunit
VIPEGWTEDLLMNLVSAQRGTEPGYEAYCEPEKGVCFLRIGDLSGKTNNPVFTKAKGLLYIGPDDILFALDGSPGLVAKGYSGAISSGIRLVKPKNQKVKKDFLFYALQSPTVQSIVKAYTTGSTILHAGRSLQFITILLPPLSEQRKIAAILSSVDNAIEKTKAIIEQTKVVKKGLMQELLTSGIPGRHKKFKKTPIGEIPEEWEVVRLGDIYEIQLGKMLSPKSKGGFNPRPYLGNYNVQWNRIDLKTIQYMDFTEKEMEKYRLRKGDLLICEGGEIGRTAIWNNELPECYYQKAIHRLRPLEHNTVPEFLLHFMLFAAEKKYFTYLTGVNTIAHLPAEQLRKIKIPLPKYKEQKEISLTINKLENILRINSNLIAEFSKFKAALMQVLLIGEVRVKV